MTVPQDKRKEGRLVVLVKALEVANYTNQILANKKKFPAELDEVLGNDIKKHGQAIYRNCKLANDLRVQKPVTGVIDEEAREARYRLQKNAIQACTELLIDIDMAFGTYHLPAKRVAHWGKITKEARDYIRKWHAADKKRYDSS